MNSYIDLPKRLQELNKDGRYNAIIERAKNFGYHDFKHDQVPGHPEYDCICPKTQLYEDLQAFPELKEVMQEVIDGLYDDHPDEVDTLRARIMFLEDDVPDSMFKVILNQDPPTPEEREQYKKQKQLN